MRAPSQYASYSALGTIEPKKSVVHSARGTNFFVIGFHNYVGCGSSCVTIIALLVILFIFTFTRHGRATFAYGSGERTVPRTGVDPRCEGAEEEANITYLVPGTRCAWAATARFLRAILDGTVLPKLLHQPRTQIAPTGRHVPFSHIFHWIPVGGREPCLCFERRSATHPRFCFND